MCLWWEVEVVRQEDVIHTCANSLHYVYIKCMVQMWLVSYCCLAASKMTKTYTFMYPPNPESQPNPNLSVFFKPDEL